jgi:hypothetical protein
MNPLAHGDWRSRLHAALARVFGIDPRSLATLRIGLAFLLLVDLAIRAGDLRAMYGDEGMVPISAVRAWYGHSPWVWSLHFLNGSVAFQGALFAIAAIAAAALFVGYRTWLATVISWVLLVSLHYRNPMVVNGGDVLLRMLLFWGMFVPLGCAWSLDVRLGRAPSPNGPVATVGTAALLIQMGLMYLLTATFKLNPTWLGGQGIVYALSYEAYVRPLGHWLAGQPGLVHNLSLATIAVEFAGPVLLFFPWRTAQARLVAVLVLASLHAGIELAITVGLFSFVCLVGLCAFLPAEFWDAAVARRGGAWLSAWFPRRAAAQETPAAASAGGEFTRWPLVGRRLADAACLALLGYVVAWNLSTLPDELIKVPLADAVKAPGRVLAVGQTWGMFARPTTQNGWYVARATLRDGDTVDLLRSGEAASFEKPADLAARYPNHRWRKLFLNLSHERNELFRQGVADYLCRSWNERHEPPRQVVAMELVYLWLLTGPDHVPGDFARSILADVELEPRPGSGNFADLLKELERGQPLWP